jgi:UDP-glucose 4-epimerase
MPITVYGDGNNVRDYIYIDDVINITKKIAISRTNKHNLYNIGTGVGYSINSVLKVIAKVTKKKLSVRYLPARDSDVKSVILNISRVKAEIGKYNFVPLANGIEKLWKQSCATDENF